MAFALADDPDGTRSWLVAAVSAVAMVFTFGMAFSYGVFLGPLSETLGISTVALSVVFAIMLFGVYIGAGAVSIVATRYSARAVVLASAGVTALVAPVLYVTESLLALIPAFAALGVTLGTVYVTLAAVVPRWFEERRGAATGLIFVGNGLGLLVVPPAWRLALNRFAVPDAFFAMVGTSALAFALAGLVARRPEWADNAEESLREQARWVRTLFADRTFQLLFVGIGLSFAWYVLVTSYAVDLFTARGLGPTLASVAFGLIGGVSLVSRMTSGLVADAVGYRRAFLASLAISSVGAMVLFGTGTLAQGLAVFLMGIGLGGTATLYIPLLMQEFSPERDTAVIGIFNVAIGVFALACPPIGTALIAQTGSFHATILLTVVATVGSLTATAKATRP